MRYRFGAQTDIGRARKRNEDSYLAEEPLFAVADGMGGHRGGNVASAMSIERLAKARVADGDPLPAVVAAIKEANRAILERGESEQDLAGMGTTTTALLVDGDKAYVAHVGDSRGYLLRDGTLQQLTEDHTMVQRLVREGRLRPEDVERHPQRSVLLRALGVEDDVTVDELTLDLLSGDRVLLCSDGLTGMLDQERIQEVLIREEDPQAACDALVEMANQAGGEDNITVVLLDALADDRAAGGGVAAADGAPGATAAEAGGQAAVPAAIVEDDRGQRPSRRRRALVWTAAVLVVIVAAFVGARVYLDRQWYVGESAGRVAIYKGIPATFLGIGLSHVDRLTDIPATGAEQLEPWKDLPDGITATNLQDALDLTTRIRADVCPSATGATGGTGGTCGTPAPSPTPSVSFSPTPSSRPSASPTA